ncbi:MAG: membrane lipoprotein lipid attachment site-containing protein, partial [Brevinematales bacterium]|nr:membrane lipoprotein lipid attachment site-containing protein [Brevinematales bacterium]
MKKFLLIALALVMVAGCSLSNQVGNGGLETEISEMGGVASLTVELDVGQNPQGGASMTKSVIGVEEYEVIGATIALSNSVGEGEVKTWKAGDSFVFTFQAKRTGMHTITVTDWDTDGNTNVATASINMKNGRNYRIKVRLGGVIYIGLTGVPRDGLVAEYLFNGNALDTSGMGNNPTNVTARLTNDRFGVLDKAYDFNVGYITVPHSESLNPKNAITISCFAKMDSFPDGYANCLIRKANSM